MNKAFTRRNLVLNFQQLASHGLFDVHVKATGDIHIDDHHTNEDVALSIGTVLPTAISFLLALLITVVPGTSNMLFFFEWRTCFNILVSVTSSPGFAASSW
jgi:hypothetical protein